MGGETSRHLRVLAELYCPGGIAPDRQPPEVALRELLRTPDGGYASSGGSQLASFQQGRVSMPDDLSGASRLIDLVSDTARQYLDGGG